MSYTSKTIFTYGLYALVVGISLLFFQDYISPLVNLFSANESWIYAVAAFALGSSYYHLAASREENQKFFRVSANARIFFAATFAAFVFYKLAPNELLGLAAIEIVSALWTKWAQCKDKQSAEAESRGFKDRVKSLKAGENRVHFDSDGCKLEANLFLPSSYKAGDLFPAVVITRPASAVKEQTVGLYAKKLSEKGFAALAFDTKGYGGSQGVPQMERPLSVVSDTLNAVTFLQHLPMVDQNKICNVGVCMGAGYATVASALDDRIKMTAAISPYLTAHIDYPKALGGVFMAKLMMIPTQYFVNLLQLLRINLYIPIVPLKKWMSYMPATPTQADMPQYYGPGKPGDTPSWKNKGNFYGSTAIMTGEYNPFNYTAEYSSKPFYLTYADGGYAPDLIRLFYEQIGASHKEIHTCENATHFDLYYKPEFVDPIVDQIDAFFRTHLR